VSGGQDPSGPPQGARGAGGLEWLHAPRETPAPTLYNPVHHNVSEAIKAAVRDITTSDDFATALFLSLVGLDLSLWLLAKGVLRPC
jgi:hypothetical protein